MIFSTTECITWLAISLTETVAIVTLNLATIIVFIRNRSLRKRSMYLVINLAVVDMFCGGFSRFMDSFYTGAYCNFWKYEVTPYGVWNNVITSILSLFPLTSQINIAAISVERMHATFRPFRHHVMKQWVYALIVTVIWIIGVLLSGIYYVDRGIYLARIRFYPYTFALVSLVCLFVICVCHLSIAVKMSGRCGARPQHHSATNRERKLTETLCIMTSLSLLLRMPNAILSLLHAAIDVFSSLSPLTAGRLIRTLVVLMYANSLINPIIYAIRIPEFKRDLVSLFSCRRQQRRSQVIPLRVNQ